MTRPQLVAALASAAKADPSDTPKVEMLVQWLEYVGLIEADGERVVAVQLSDVKGVSPEHRVSLSVPLSEVPAAPAGAKGQESTTVRAVARPAPIVSLALNLTVTAEDLGKLTPEQIAALFNGVGEIAAIQAALAAP